MGKIERFFGKPVECSIGGEKYMLKPFSVKDLPMLSKLSEGTNDEKSEALLGCIYFIAKQIDSDCTKEQLGEISFEYLEDFSDAIVAVNNIEIDDAKKALIEKIKAKQNGQTISK
jgi:hypothetical protein